MQDITSNIQINDLLWWTNADHIVDAAARAGVDLVRSDISFAEHKVNGKSKGTVIIACHSVANAVKLVSWFRSNDFQGKRLAPTHFTGSNKIPQHVPRPALGTQALLAHGPTNAHGGINFNRVRPQIRAQPWVKKAYGYSWDQRNFHAGQAAPGPGYMTLYGDYDPYA